MRRIGIDVRRHQYRCGAARGRAGRPYGEDPNDRRRDRRALSARSICCAGIKRGGAGGPDRRRRHRSTTHLHQRGGAARRHLRKVAAVRIGMPAAASLPPFCDWPQDLAALVAGEVFNARRRPRLRRSRGSCRSTGRCTCARRRGASANWGSLRSAWRRFFAARPVARGARGGDPRRGMPRSVGGDPVAQAGPHRSPGARERGAAQRGARRFGAGDDRRSSAERDRRQRHPRPRSSSPRTTAP